MPQAAAGATPGRRMLLFSAAFALAWTCLALACGAGAADEPADPATRQFGFEVSDSEREVLADGLTFAEYERAFFAYLACAAEDGWIPSEPPRLTSRREYYVLLYRPNSNPNASEGERAQWLMSIEQCRTTYFNAVQAEWARQNMLTEQERREARTFIRDCIREAGYDYPEDPGPETWPEFMLLTGGRPPTLGADEVARLQVGDECAQQMQEHFGLLPGEVP